MRLHTLWPRISAIAVALVVLPVAFALGGCGFSVSCGADKAGGVETYADPDYGYSFAYPSNWVLDEDTTLEVESGINRANGVSVFDPDGANADGSYLDLFEVSVYELGFTVDESMMPDIKPELEALMADAGTQDATWKTVEALADAKVAGLSGFKATIEHSVDGTPVKSTTYFLFNGSIEYELILQAMPENWQAKQAEFSAMVASFKPGTTTGTTLPQ
jgi:hypothetical protein